MEKVILVNNKDIELGYCEKLEAHQKALLHRAISVLIFNTKGELLLHKRSINKYHSGGLWTNATCTHPKPNESNIDAAYRRLKEEMGLETELVYISNFIYKAELDNNLTEYEYDHIFFGITDNIPILNLEEAQEFKYISFLNLLCDIEQNPDKYTIWFKIILKQVEAEILKTINKFNN